MLDCRLVGRKVEEQFMKAAHMLTGLRRAVLLHVLRQGKHEGLAVVEDVDFLTLLFSEIENHYQGHGNHHRTHRHEHYPEKTDLTER